MDARNNPFLGDSMNEQSTEDENSMNFSEISTAQNNDIASATNHLEAAISLYEEETSGIIPFVEEPEIQDNSAGTLALSKHSSNCVKQEKTESPRSFVNPEFSIFSTTVDKPFTPEYQVIEISENQDSDSSQDSKNLSINYRMAKKEEILMNLIPEEMNTEPKVQFNEVVHEFPHIQHVEQGNMPETLQRSEIISINRDRIDRLVADVRNCDATEEKVLKMTGVFDRSEFD